MSDNHHLIEDPALRAEMLATRATEHEQQLLACCLADHIVATEVIASGLKPSAFYRAAHKAIFRAIKGLADRHDPIDLISVKDELARLGVSLEEAGGFGYLVELTGSIPTTAHAGYYLKRVKETASRRELAAVAHAIKEAALNPDLEDPTSHALGLILGLEGESGGRRRRKLSEVIRSQVGQMEAAYNIRKAGGQSPVAQTGLYDLDNLVVMGPQKLLILAARPAMGKSALAWQIALNVAAGRPVYFQTLEMAGEELAGRMIAAELGIDANRQAHGVVRESEWADLWALAERYDDHLLEVADDPAASIAQIEAGARRYQAEMLADSHGPLGLVVVDYLGLVDGEGESENHKIGRITRAAKQMAKALNTPVILLAQLSRAVEKRDNKRPMMSDLRDSGSIEQDADVVMFVYRDEYYNPDTEKKGAAEVIVPKNRGGQPGTVELFFEGKATRFSSVGYTVPPADTWATEAPPEWDDN